MTDISTRAESDAEGHDEHGAVLPNGRPAPAPIRHEPRRADVDPKAARRAEHQVATMFGLATLSIIAFCVLYFAVPTDALVSLPLIGDTSASNVALGVSFGLAIFLIGTGAIHWAKKLMPDVEVVQERHELRSTDDDRAAAVEVFEAGAADSGFGSRRIIRRSLLGALVLFPIPLVVMLRDLWATPNSSLAPRELLNETIWREGVAIVKDGTYEKVRPEDLAVGGLINAVPENLREVEEAEGNLNARAKAAIILVRMQPDEIVSQQGDNWDYEGILAFSKICTHMGCPISLYEQRTHHLLCPCHQSTFDLADSAAVVFGPAARNMPQLHIGVDEEGFLVAKAGFAEAVGPTFWERYR